MRNHRRIPLLAGFLLAVVVLAAILFYRSPRPANETPQSAPPEDLIASPSSQQSRESVAPSLSENTGVVAGVVRSAESGELVGDVTVVAVPASGGEPLQTRSAHDGQWYLDEIVAGEDYVIRVDNGGKPPFAVNELVVRVNADEVVEDQTLFVDDAGSISGRVVRLIPARFTLPSEKTMEATMQALADSMSAEPEKQPLPGVRLTLVRKDSAVTSNFRHETVSDAQGNFHFRRIPVGMYELDPETPEGAVVLDAAQRMPLNHVLATSAGTRDIEIGFRFDSLVVTGRVVNRVSQPIAGAKVLASAHVPDLTFYSVEQATETDAHGRYTLPGLPSANDFQVLQATSSNFVGDGCTLVVHADGYASIRTVVPTVLDSQLVGMGLQNKADRGLPTNVPLGPARDGIHAEVTPEGRQTIHVPDIVLDGHATVAGRVRDTQGRVVANAEIRAVLYGAAHSGDSAHESTPPLPATTGMDGSFLLGGLGEGQYRFHVSQPALQIFEESLGDPLTIAVGDHITGADIVVASREERGTIRGNVILADASSVPRSVNAFVEDVVSTAGETAIRNGELHLDPKKPGEFEIMNVSPGIARLRVWVPPHPMLYQAVRVIAGQTTTVTIQIAPVGAVAGSVTRDGRPVPNARAHLYVDGIARDIDTAAIDETGAFLFEDVAPGEYLVSASVSSPQDRFEGRRVTVKSGETIRVDFALDGDARLSGAFQAPPEFERRKVYVQLPGTDPVSPDNDGQIAASAVATDNAFREKFSFEGLPDGQFQVVAIAYNNRNTGGKVEPGALVATELVTLRAGETATVNFDLR